MKSQCKNIEEKAEKYDSTMCCCTVELVRLLVPVARSSLSQRVSNVVVDAPHRMCWFNHRWRQQLVKRTDYTAPHRTAPHRWHSNSIHWPRRRSLPSLDHRSLTLTRYALADWVRFDWIACNTVATTIALATATATCRFLPFACGCCISATSLGFLCAIPQMPQQPTS